MIKKFILADDHPLIIKGNKTYISEMGYEILETYDNGLDAYLGIIKFHPNVAILDYNMPKMTGMEVAHKIAQVEIPTRLILFSVHKNNDLIKEVGHSIHGYLTKDCPMEEIKTCIEVVLNQKTYIGKSLQEDIFTITGDHHQKIAFTPSEIKILTYLRKNLSSSEIAQELFISKRTVEKHRSNIIKKIGLQSNHQNELLIWLQKHPEVLELFPKNT